MRHRTSALQTRIHTQMEARGAAATMWCNLRNFWFSKIRDSAAQRCTFVL